MPPPPCAHAADPAMAEGAPGARLCRPARIGLVVFGWTNVALGVLGMFLPVMPTTVFLLIALWAFSRSSARFHRWLYDHPRLGRPLRDWHARRVIPRRAKVLALGMMSASVITIYLFSAEAWWLPAVVAACLAPVAAFIATRPSTGSS